MEKLDLPLGFGMALAQNESAMARFETLSQEKKQAILQKVHAVRSRAEMQALVRGISQA